MHHEQWPLDRHNNDNNLMVLCAPSSNVNQLLYFEDCYDITIGGSQGANPQVGELHRKGVPATEVRSALKEILIEQFGAKPKAA